jgi:hypothetical protein
LSEHATTSEILRTLADSDEDSISVGDVVSAMGLRVHGIALILFALPDAAPLPIPSLSAVLGIPLVFIAAHLALFGEGSGLPQRALKAKVSGKVLRVLARFGAPVLQALEFFSRPRLRAVLRYERWIGLVCLYLSILLLLPIPFVNFAPALCLVLIALGMVQRDGLLTAIGLVATIVMTVSLGFAAQWLAGLFGG